MMMRSCSDLPEEIIVDILSRLPAKSVGLCRCVSKPWRALLNRPEFIKTHLHRSRDHPEESLILFDYRRCMFTAPLSNAHQLFDEITVSATKLSFPDHPEIWSSVHASCDGLLLVDDEIGKELVLNPITREIREVPHSPYALGPFTSFALIWGFGYDSVSDDYKIVTISFYDADLDDDGNVVEPECTDMFVNVYSLKTGSWKKSECSPYDHSYADEFDSGVFVNGCIHWLASRRADFNCAIVVFDLAEEKFYELQPPILVHRNKLLLLHLAELGGCLCMFDEIGNDVWVMKQYGVKESWTKFTINDLKSEEIKLLCLLGQEEVVILKNDNKLQMYNLKERALKDIVVHGIAEDLYAKLSFVGSLVSPHAWW